MTRTKNTPKALNDYIADLARRAKLDSWNSFVRELNVPSPIAIAMMTNRPEMLATVERRPLSAEEMGVLLDLIGGLMETNAALREHAAEVAKLTENWASNFQALVSTGRKIEDFARFRHNQMEEEDA